MSVAPCFADTNDLALDQPQTAEDTQHTLQSILSHTGSVFSSLSISPSVLLPSYLFFFCYQRCNLSPQSFSIPPIFPFEPLIHSFSFQLLAVHRNLFHSVSFLFPFYPSFSPPFLSLSLSPANSFIVLGSGWTMSSHMGPLCSPSREGREHQKTPITQCFNWASG